MIMLSRSGPEIRFLRFSSHDTLEMSLDIKLLLTVSGKLDIRVPPQRNANRPTLEDAIMRRDIASDWGGHVLCSQRTRGLPCTPKVS